MPRKPRVEYEGAVYHVMARGNNRQVIVKSKRDWGWFVETLGQACTRAGWVLHAYVLMRNHYHLLLETPQGNLVEGMRWLQGTWTARYNARNHCVGHLFQGRYKAIPVQAGEGYFLTLANYIHLNPARAGLAGAGKAGLRSYRWSSFPAYCKKDKPPWLERSWVLAELGDEDNARGRLAYARQVEKLMFEEGLGGGSPEVEKRWEEIRKGWVCGSESFAAEMLDKVRALLDRSGKLESFGGEEVRMCKEQEAEEQLRRWLKKLGLKSSELKSLRKGDENKAVLALKLKSCTCMSNTWIAGRLSCGHPANIPRLVNMAKSARPRSSLWKKLRMLQCED